MMFDVFHVRYDTKVQLSKYQSSSKQSLIETAMKLLNNINYVILIKQKIANIKHSFILIVDQRTKATHYSHA